MPKRITQTQINTMPEGRVLFGRRPDLESRARIEAGSIRLVVDKGEFRATIDSLNLNDKYVDTLALVEGYFVSRHLETAPVRVVDKVMWRNAYGNVQFVSGGLMDDLQGAHIYDRAVVIEDEAALEEFGDDYVLGVALHEAAHSSDRNEYHICTVEKSVDRTSPTSVQTGIGRLIISGGLRKADMRKGAKSDEEVGMFWEEAFADLTRVRALRVLGHTHDVEGPSLNGELMTDDDRMMVVAPNNTAAQSLWVTRNTLVLPAEFALASKTRDNHNFTKLAYSNLAAYALELLDTAVPGIYDDLEMARNEPKLQAQAIRKINSIRPGLYRELRDLGTSQDFAKGLRVVIGVLREVADKTYTTPMAPAF